MRPDYPANTAIERSQIIGSRMTSIYIREVVEDDGLSYTQTFFQIDSMLYLQLGMTCDPLGPYDVPRDAKEYKDRQLKKKILGRRIEGVWIDRGSLETPNCEIAMQFDSGYSVMHIIDVPPGCPNGLHVFSEQPIADPVDYWDPKAKALWGYLD